MQPTRSSRKNRDGDENSRAVVPQGRQSTPPTSGRPSHMQVALSNLHHEPQQTVPGTGRLSQMQAALSGREHSQASRSNEPAQSKYSAPASQMQVALPGREQSQPSRSDKPAESKYSARPSQMQVALPGHRSKERSRHQKPAQSTYSGRTSQVHIELSDHARYTKVLIPVREIRVIYHEFLVQRSDYSSRLETSLHEDRSDRYPESSHTTPYGQTRSVIYDAEPGRRATRKSSIRDDEPNRRAARNSDLTIIRESGPIRSTYNGMAATREVARTQGQPTRIVRPGEPHHFGSWTDHQKGQVMCTTCRCSNPDSHGDAYTMLDSPRGYDINHMPIDWQQVKNRMLDHHGKEQISHQQEIEAVPFVFDAETAIRAWQHEKELCKAARNGQSIHVNVLGNNMGWFTEGGQAKSHITSEGAKTQNNRDGGS
jgi:hypothetical protein